MNILMSVLPFGANIIMKKQFIFCIAALLCAACAQKEAVIESGEIEPENTATEQEEVKTGFPYTLTASFAKEDETPATKVEFTNPTPADPKTATWSVEWNVGDVIYVANQVGADKTVAYEVESVTAGVATFKLKDGEDVSKFNENTTYYAAKGGTTGYLPYIQSFDTTNRGLFYIGLPSVMSLEENTIHNDYFLAVATGTLEDGKLNFSFRNVNSYIRLVIPEGMEKSVGEIYIAGSVTNKFATGYKNVRMNPSTGEIAGVSQYKSGSTFPGARLYGRYYYGNSTLSSITDLFKPGVYYLPIHFSATPNGIEIRDEDDKAFITRSFDALTLERGHGTIPTTADD